MDGNWKYNENLWYLKRKNFLIIILSSFYGVTLLTTDMEEHFFILCSSRCLWIEIAASKVINIFFLFTSLFKDMVNDRDESQMKKYIEWGLGGSVVQALLCPWSWGVPLSW